MNIDRNAPVPRSRPLRAILIATALAFLGGLAVMGWAFTHWAPAVKLLPVAAVEAPVAPTASAPPPASSGPSTVTPASPPAPSTDDAHVAALEMRLAEIDRHAVAAADQASRAEGLLIAAAARRAVDRGVALGYIEGQLTAHYGTSQPRAVANIIAASHAPVTLDSLRAGLDGVMTEAAPAANPNDWWGRVRASFSGLITVRKAGQPSTAPDERLNRARLALSTGAVENALADVARLPGGGTTNAWMTNARRYIEAHSALDVLEAAALTRPEVSKPAPPPPVAPPPQPIAENAAGSI